jgi:hypothetical protein
MTVDQLEARISVVLAATSSGPTPRVVAETITCLLVDHLFCALGPDAASVVEEAIEAMRNERGHCMINASTSACRPTTTIARIKRFATGGCGDMRLAAPAGPVAAYKVNRCKLTRARAR